MNKWVDLCAALLVLSVFHGASAAANYRADQRDLNRFIEDRDACDHFRGEIPDPTQRQRMDEVLEAIKAHCHGTDDRLQALKKRYRTDDAVLRRLGRYESNIEHEGP